MIVSDDNSSEYLEEKTNVSMVDTSQIPSSNLKMFLSFDHAPFKTVPSVGYMAKLTD